MSTPRRRIVATLLAGILAISLGMPARAVDPAAQLPRPLPERLAELRLETPGRLGGEAAGKIREALAIAAGPRQVVVRLAELASADVAADGAEAQRGQLRRARAQQDAVIGLARQLDRHARILGRTGRASNVVMLEITPQAILGLAADPAVVAISPVRNYQTALAETVPHVGAPAVHGSGFDGSGVRVAVLDSGIDYTHAAFGGPGTLEAYEAAYGTGPADPRNTTTDGLFPTARVVGGHDFVGEFWTGEVGSPPLAPDPDPIDFDGHGTHVADILAGAAGVAPGASLYALKVCSSVTAACSGVALIQAMDFVVDPNGDGSTSDRLDIVNMSLGALYGIAFDDDLSLAVDRASRLGVLTVTAAGNAGNKPYVVDTPGATTSALSVAQTAVPSAVQAMMHIIAPPAIAGSYLAVFQPWSAPLTSVLEGPVQYGDGAGGNLLGCEPLAPGSATGMIVLVDRGDCFFSDKISNVEAGGAIAGIIGLVAPGDPFEGGFGDGAPPTIPGFMISQADASLIKAHLGEGVVARFDPADGIPLVGSMVGSSSRGPAMDTNLLKPEIGAPGASVSAVVGTGTGTAAFGGTSGATPMVAGAAALLREAFPRRSAGEIRALLMNTAETEITTNPALAPGVLAPISRIGGGELRVDRALTSRAAAWDTRTEAGGLSFGLVDASGRMTTVSRMVTVRNYSSTPVTYRITPTFRFEDDAANGAIQILAPRSITVAPGRTRAFAVTLRIDGSRLHPWTMNSGPAGASPEPLDLLEYDGHILFDDVATAADDADPLHIAWHLLPRRAGHVRALPPSVRITGTYEGLPAGSTRLRNDGVGTADVEVFSLVGTSPNLPASVRGSNAPVIDLRAVGVQTFPVPAGFCSPDESFVYQFAINTWERTTHALAHNEFWVSLDTDGDGGVDYIVLNADLSGPGGLSDGRSMTWSYDVTENTLDAWFFTSHISNSAATVLTVCGEQIGMNAADFFSPMTMDVVAWDWYFTGLPTDSIEDLTVAPLGERYLGILGADGVAGGEIGPFTTQTLTAVDYGAAGTNPTETGLLLFLGAASREREAILLPVRP